MQYCKRFQYSNSVSYPTYFIFIVQTKLLSDLYFNKTVLFVVDYVSNS